MQYPTDAHLLTRLTFDRAERVGVITTSPKGTRLLVACPCCTQAMVLHGHEAVCSNTSCQAVALTLPEYLVWSDYVATTGIINGALAKSMVDKLSDLFPDVFSEDSGATMMLSLVRRIQMRRRLIHLLAKARRRSTPDPLLPEHSTLLSKMQAVCDHRTAWRGYAFLLTADEVKAVLNITVDLLKLDGSDIQPNEDQAKAAFVIPSWVSYTVPGKLRLVSVSEEEDVDIDPRHSWEGLWTTVPFCSMSDVGLTRDRCLEESASFVDGHKPNPTLLFNCAVDMCDTPPEVCPKNLIMWPTPSTESEWQSAFCLDRHARLFFRDREGKPVSMRDVLLREIRRLFDMDTTGVGVSDFVYKTGASLETLVTVKRDLDTLGLSHVLVTAKGRPDLVPLSKGEYARETTEGVLLQDKGNIVKISNYTIELAALVEFSEDNTGYLVRGHTKHGVIDAVIPADSVGDYKHVTRQIGQQAAAQTTGFIPMITNHVKFKEYFISKLNNRGTLEAVRGFASLGFDKTSAFSAPGWRCVDGKVEEEASFRFPSGNLWLSSYEKIAPFPESGDWPHLVDEFSIRSLAYLAGAIFRARFRLESPPFKIHADGTSYLDDTSRLVGQLSLDMCYRQDIFTRDSQARGWPLFLSTAPAQKTWPAAPMFHAAYGATRPTFEAVTKAYQTSFKRVVLMVAKLAQAAKQAPSWLEPESKPTIDSVIYQGERLFRKMEAPWAVPRLSYVEFNKLFSSIPLEDTEKEFTLHIPTQQVRIRRPKGIHGSNLMLEAIDICDRTTSDGTFIFMPERDFSILAREYYGREPKLG